jgi:hypothetical protein
MFVRTHPTCLFMTRVCMQAAELLFTACEVPDEDYDELDLTPLESNTGKL